MIPGRTPLARGHTKGQCDAHCNPHLSERETEPGLCSDQALMTGADEVAKSPKTSKSLPVLMAEYSQPESPTKASGYISVPSLNSEPQESTKKDWAKGRNNCSLLHCQPHSQVCGGNPMKSKSTLGTPVGRCQGRWLDLQYQITSAIQRRLTEIRPRG